MLGVDGRRLHDLRDAGADGCPLRRLDHEQLEVIAPSPGDRIYLGTYHHGHLGLLGRVSVARVEDGGVIAAAPLAKCDFSVEVPHEQARALRFLDGSALRFARTGDYELHPAALLRPLELSEQSTSVLEALVRSAPQEKRPATDSESSPARTPAQPRTAPRRPESELDTVGFSSRTRNLLGRLQLSDLQQLAECTEERLRSVAGAGAATLEEIRSKLEQHGLRLVAESDSDMAGFSVPTRDVLGRLHVLNLQQLAKCTEERVRSVRGAGADTLEEIRSKLAEHGLELAAQSELHTVGFSVPTRSVLGRLNVLNLQQLAECTEERVLSVPRAGAGTLQEIQSKLAEHGLELAAAPAAPRYPDERIAKADSRARRMVMLRGEGRTLAEIGQQYGLSLERVRRILARSGAPDKAQAAEARSRGIRNPVQARAKELTARWARGEEISELAREAGVGRRVVAEVILATATAADRANHVAAKSARRDSNVYTDAQLLEGLKRAAGELGRAPTNAEYDQWASRTGGVARAKTVMGRFDGWLSALHAAGLSEQETSHRSGRRWTEDACIAAVHMIARETGGWPTVAEYDRLSSSRDDLPSSGTLRSRLGRWSVIAASATTP
ncbi:MAG TPA: DNA-directed RNA polymerase subunit alpha C-terminal domain-containing protein [Solirubrobacteraceae bacterium]